MTVDRALIEAAHAAVASGAAASMSAWVNDALAQHAAKARRLAALADLVAEYEADFGVITAAELAAQQRADRRNAIVVRGAKRVSARKPRRSRAA